jgi:hypothetical protein
MSSGRRYCRISRTVGIRLEPRRLHSYGVGGAAVVLTEHFGDLADREDLEQFPITLHRILRRRGSFGIRLT